MIGFEVSIDPNGLDGRSYQAQKCQRCPRIIRVHDVESMLSTTARIWSQGVGIRVQDGGCNAIQCQKSDILSQGWIVVSAEFIVSDLEY